MGGLPNLTYEWLLNRLAPRWECRSVAFEEDQDTTQIVHTMIEGNKTDWVPTTERHDANATE